VLQVVQFLFREPPVRDSRYQRIYETFASSPPAAVLPGVCEPPPLFPTDPPISSLNEMALMTEVRRVADEFEFTDEEVNRSVKEFIVQMSACPNGTTRRNTES
jgi:hypothetical protein